MVAMHGLLSFGSDKNAFVAIGAFGCSVPEVFLLVLKLNEEEQYWKLKVFI